MELVITKSQMSDYLNSLDFNNIVIKKVFANLQLLRTDLFTSVLELLITGKLTINQLNLISINNTTIKSLIDSTLSTPSGLVEKTVYYRENLIKPLTGYTNFLLNLSQDTIQYIAKTNLSSKTFVTEVKIDSLRLTEGYFSSFQKAKIEYDNILSGFTIDNNYNLNNSGSFFYTDIPTLVSGNEFVLTYEPLSLVEVYINGVFINDTLFYQNGTQLLIDLSININPDEDYVIVTYSTSSTNINVSLLGIYNTVINELNSYRLIYSDGVPLKLDYTKSILGFILRLFYQHTFDLNTILDDTPDLRDYTFLQYKSIKDNTNWYLNELALDYDIDTLKSGVYTNKRLITEYNWDRLNNITNVNDFINEFTRLIFLRTIVPTWFGTTAFSASFISNELKTANLIFKYFISIYDSIYAISTSIKDNLYANVS